jgi:hypothetical protein
MRSARFVAACALIGCGQPLPSSSTASATRQVAAVTPPRADFTVVPAELADDGILDRIRHRTRVRQFGTAWLGLESAPIQASRAGKFDLDHVLPVIGETRTKIRIVTEDDAARLAVWIARADTSKAILVPLQLSDRAGVAPPNAGVWVTIGAPVEVTTSRGARRSVRVVDTEVRVEGFAPANAIGNIWLTARDDRTPTDLDLKTTRSWTPPSNARSTLRLGTRIRAAAEPHAPVIATVERPDVRGRIVASAGAVRELEVVRRYARIRGFVAASDVSDAPDDLKSYGSGSGHGFGMSHADRIDLVPGTCLFDAVEGEVVGVQLAPSTRLGHRKTDHAAWSIVYVGTVWSTATLYIRNTSDDPKQPRWESCARSGTDR